MRKLVAAILLSLLLVGCAGAENTAQTLPAGDGCAFLTDADWEGNDGRCVNVIRFGEDGSFSNWCHCGSPVGDGDLAETFRYDAESRSFTLYDTEDLKVATGRILYCDSMYLVVTLWDGCYVYRNLESPGPEVRACAQAAVGVWEEDMPCLTVLGLEDGLLSVSACNYDGDAPDGFGIWQLETAEDVRFSCVTVTDDNGTETVETLELGTGDPERIGEDFTYAYLRFDADGRVTRVVFYGETVISG